MKTTRSILAALLCLYIAVSTMTALTLPAQAALTVTINHSGTYTVNPRSTVTLSVTLSGMSSNTAYSLQWQRRLAGETTWSSMGSNYQTPEISFTAKCTVHSWRSYRCRVQWPGTSGAETKYSSVCTLSVRQIANDISSKLIQPANSTVDYFMISLQFTTARLIKSKIHTAGYEENDGITVAFKTDKPNSFYFGKAFLNTSGDDNPVKKVLRLLEG